MGSDSQHQTGLTGYIIAHTHWDREWYLPFQGFRRRLVTLMDELLNLMEHDSEYTHFHLDGQTSVLEDYLEVRPENTERVKRLVGCGRLLVGPWYVQPDESLPSAEAHIRNLLLGHCMAREFGAEALKVGYVVDVFGHISQLPQILRGFGIDNALLFRGMNDDQCGAECWWEGADGSRVLVLRLSNDVAYSDFWYKVRHPQMGSDFDVETAVGDMEAFANEFIPRFSTRHILFMDGVDHVEAEPRLSEFIRAFNRRHGGWLHLKQASLAGYVARLQHAVESTALPTFRGELREPNRRGRLSNLFAGIHSSRAHLKQENDRCESLLTAWAEPWGAIAWLLGAEYPARYLDLAWRFLLQNQPHDSICGCSIDQVHKDMIHRFDQCRMIAEGIVGDALDRITAQVHTRGPEGAAHAVVVFGTAPSQSREAEVITVELPHPRPAHFRLVGARGEDLPYQILEEQSAQPRLQVGVREIPSFLPRDILTLACKLSVPMVGLDVVHVVPSPTPVRHTGSQFAGPATMENEDLRVQASEDGTLRIEDKATGRTYTDLLTFEDGGDVGDGWTFTPPAEDEVVLSRGGACSVARLYDGPLVGGVRIEKTMLVPECIGTGQRKRSGTRVPLRVMSDVLLFNDERAVRVRTRVENTVRDHRLRVLFPTDLQAVSWHADMQFDIVERAIALRNTSDWVEPESELKPQQSFACITDGEAGLAIVAPRQKEAAARDDARRTLALTLLRGFGSTVGTSGEEGAQSLGTQDFEYAIVPFSFDPRSAGLLGVAARMRSGLRTRVAPPQEGAIEPRTSFVLIAPGEMQLSAIKRHETEDLLVVRLWNPMAHDINAVVTVAAGLAEAWSSAFGEERGAALRVDGRSVTLPVRPKEAATVLLRVKR